MSETNPIQLLYKEEDDDGVAKVVLSIEDILDACMKVHKSIGYQGRAGMEKEGAKFYTNMTWPIIELFLQYSVNYKLKQRKTINYSAVFHPIRSENLNSRMQIDLVDFQSLPDGDLKWVLNAQDHLTKFCHLRPLRDKTAFAVANELYRKSWIITPGLCSCFDHSPMGQSTIRPKNVGLNGGGVLCQVKAQGFYILTLVLWSIAPWC